MYVCAVRFDLHIPDTRSLKGKRAVVKPIVEGLRRRFHVAAAAVDHHEQWQRAAVGVAVVASSHRHVCDILDEVERFVWSHPEVQVLESARSWLESGDG